MAEHSYESLRKKTIAELRDIAKDLEHEAVQGYTQMRKDELLMAVCTAVGVDPKEHHHVVGIDKKAIKARIQELKAERDAAIEAQDRQQLKRVRRKIHKLKHQLRAATV
jgi:DNA-binding IclR family transcriptional regulator